MNHMAKNILRRLYYGMKILCKFALISPILLFMVYFSYKVDRSGLFQGALGPRTVVDLMLSGHDVTNFEQMDERSVVSLYAQDVPEDECPSVIGIGSSRVLQFNREVIGTDSYFSMGVTGADVRDNMTSYYVMVRAGKAPDVLVWSVDPWVLYGSEKAFDSRADSELYNEFLTKVLGVETDYEEPDKVELWKALADPTRRKILELLKNKSLNAGEIAAEFNMTKPSISNHLSILKQADLVDSEKIGQNVIYSLKTSVLEDMLKMLSDLTGREDK